eukprot:TRINITY_DN784_c0_g1_i1.p1 TRINITY_DN784_c0_g1~~TRINITY_DN784_c0_g1_i1.p1  ORF type:complete len:181 (-),score=14.95 TRINITY_DN784_c0_g1_i1:5-547(-)
MISKGKLTANISLNKSETMIQTVFRIKGSIELECDRSLDLFNFPIDLERPFIYKLGNEHEELSDEVVVIPRDTQQLNVASIMFEFIGLEIPMKKLHPRFQEEDDDIEAEVLMIYSCLLYTSDAADDLLCVDLGGRRIIKKKKQIKLRSAEKRTTINNMEVWYVCVNESYHGEVTNIQVVI